MTLAIARAVISPARFLLSRNARVYTLYTFEKLNNINDLSHPDIDGVVSMADQSSDPDIHAMGLTLKSW